MTEVRTDGAARGERSSLQLSRVATEEDKVKEEDAVKTVKFLSFSLSFQLFTCIESVEPTTNRAQNDACISSVEVRRRKTEG